jgi:hypothetical protein
MHILFFMYKHSLFRSLLTNVAKASGTQVENQYTRRVPFKVEIGHLLA